MSFLKHPVVLISLGGALGANARYWLGAWIRSRSWYGAFPWGTFIANISGSLLLALVVGFFLTPTTHTRQLWFLFLGTGFCGAYTTFSTFEVETYNLIHEGRWPLALLNVLGSVVGGFIVVVIGASLIKGPPD